MEWTAEAILGRLKAGLKNEDSRIEGSFTMDNLQAVAEELARYGSMLVQPLWDEIDMRIDEVVTSGNENHYVFWARQVEDASGNKVVGNARAYGVRDGSGTVYLALISPDASAPAEETVKLVDDYIQAQRPVGARPVVSAAEALEVSVNGVIELQEGADLETIRAQAQSDVKTYLAEIALDSRTDIVLNYYRVGMIIGAVEGVKEIMDYTVNGGEESLNASYSQFFDLKGLTLNASG